MAKPNYDKMKKNIQDQVGEGSLMRAEDDKALMGSLDEAAAQGKESLKLRDCLLYTSPSPRDLSTSRMPSSA